MSQIMPQIIPLARGLASIKNNLPTVPYSNSTIKFLGKRGNDGHACAQLRCLSFRSFCAFVMGHI
jgi:hypothetical protein